MFDIFNDVLFFCWILVCEEVVLVVMFCFIGVININGGVVVVGLLFEGGKKGFNINISIYEYLYFFFLIEYLFKIRLFLI